MRKKWIYLPVETKVRELYGKLFLACVAAKNGFDVIVGSKKDVKMRVGFLPKGIYFTFGLALNFAKNSKKLKEKGHKVVAIDEEGLVTLNDELYLRYRVSKETLNATDMIFCWGKKQASLVREKSKETDCGVFITGNPRFDLLRPECQSIFNSDVEKIKEKYGKIILINTNFGHANHFSGEQFAIRSLKKKGWMNNLEDEKYFLRRIEWQKEIYIKFLEMIPELSEKFKNYSIIIRPHPSENHDNWKKIEKNYKNVFVINSGNVIPWIISANLLIHNGCTTAIEAFLLGVKAVAYRPLIINDLESELPNKISTQAISIKELINISNRVLSKNINPDDNLKKEYLGNYLSGTDSYTASERIISILKSNVSFDGKKINKLALLLFEFLNYCKKATNKFLKKEDKNNYQLHKVPELTKKEVEDIISNLSKIDKEFLNLKVEKIGETCIHIYKD
jgi:surface carbohydrate biosynthesis protein